MFHTKHLFAAALGASVFASAPAAFAQETVELIYNNTLPPFNETFQVGIRDFAKLIEEESGGTIKVTIPDGAIAPADRQYEAVRDGVADMALLNVSTVTQIVALNGIGELPGFAETSESGSVALWETFKEHFEPIGEWKGVKVLATSVLPGRSILSVSDRVPDTPAALEGARIWATSSPLIAAAEAMGGVPMDTAYPELQEFVSRGLLDVLFIGPGSADGAGVLENVTHITRIPGGVGSISFAAIISDEAWGRLNDDQKAAVLRAAEGLPRRLGEANDEGEIAVADKIASIPTTRPEGEALEAFKADIQPQVDAWIERAKAAGLENPQEAIDFYQEVMAREAASN